MNQHEQQRRPLGNTEILISPVALGCWPIAGMTSLDVNDRDSIATLHAAVECGVNFLDTAYCYGAHGESERLIARALGERRDELVIATKCGIHFDEDGGRVFNGRPERLRQEVEESLIRLETDRVELLYLHAPDPAVPLTESAGELRRLQQEGKARTVGVSNVNTSQLEAFHAECKLSAYQPPYNMLQREIEQSELPWCRENQVSAFVYWPLMKGLLAGRMGRDFKFRANDGRAKYPMFQGDEWLRNCDFVDQLREIAHDAGKTVSQLVVNWTIHQPGVTAALCGGEARLANPRDRRRHGLAVE